MNPEQSFLVAAITLAAVVVLGGSLWLLRHRRRPLNVDQALRRIAVATLRDILVPDGNGGQIYIEYLLLTNKGIAIIDVKEFRGSIFASDRMQEWTMIGAEGRFGFPNPQATLYDRVAAARQFLSGVPVEGFIVFSSAAEFTTGLPRHVMLASELERHFKRPSKDESEQLLNAYRPHWQKLLKVSETATAESARAG